MSKLYKQRNWRPRLPDGWYHLKLTDKGLLFSGPKRKIPENLTRGQQSRFFYISTTTDCIPWFVAMTTSTKPCKLCGKKLEYVAWTTEGSRNNRIFCNDLCKAKEQRKKMRLAKSLHSNGISIEELSEFFDAKPETIKNWIKEKG